MVGGGTGCCGHAVHNIPFVGGEQAVAVRWTEHFVVMLTRHGYKVCMTESGIAGLRDGCKNDMAG